MTWLDVKVRGRGHSHTLVQVCGVEDSRSSIF